MTEQVARVYRVLALQLGILRLFSSDFPLLGETHVVVTPSVVFIYPSDFPLLDFPLLALCDVPQSC